MPELHSNLQSVDDWCDRFEADWKAGRRPSLPDYLARWRANGGDASAAELFRALLGLDVDYRRKAGESIVISDYEFAEFHQIIQEEVHRAGLAETFALQNSKTKPRTVAAGKPASGMLGGYELLEVLGKGGMGVVYKARQPRLNRFVAIKMLLSGGQASEEEVRRFHVEAEAAAKLDHPHIVPIYEVGEEHGQHFFSMAYVEGPSLAKQLRDEPFPVRAAVEMVSTIATAVHYAHSQGIIHRDLKPANILLGLDGRPRITDFGLAKTLENAADLTTTGQILGTPSYMAPEQALGKVSDISPRSDVYALGAILYEALVGRPPFRDASVWETLQQVIHTEPVSPRVFSPGVPRDLETIVLKALQKQPAARFASAQDFADDLGRFLRDEPILARPVSRAEKAWRWIRKNRTVATLTAAMLLLVVVIAGGSALSSYLLNQQEGKRKQLAGEKETLQTEKVNLEKQTTTLKKESRSDRYYSEMVQAGEALRIPTGIGRVREFVDPWAKDQETPDLRGWEWHLLRSAAHEEFNFIEIKTPAGLYVPLSTIAFHPRDEVMALGSKTGDLFVGPIENPAQIQVGTDHEQHVTSVAWRPDGGQIATASLDGRVLLWEPQPLRKSDEIKFGPIVFAVDYSPDGKWLAAMVQDDGIHVLDARTKERVAHLTEKIPSQSTMTFSPRGDLLAVSGYLGGDSYDIHLWDTATWQNQSLANNTPLVGHKQQVSRINWSKSGDRLLSSSFDRSVKEWSVPQHKLLHSFDNHSAQVTAAQFARSDRQIVSVGWDYAFRRSDIASQREIYLGRGHSKRVEWCDLNAAGDLLATVGEDGVVRFWDLQEPRAAIVERQHAAKCLDDPYPRLSWKRDGKQLAASLNSTTCVWKGLQFSPGTEVGALPEWSAGDAYFSLWQVDVLQVRDVRGQPVRTFKSPEKGFGNCRSAWSQRDARLLISTGSQLFLWDVNEATPKLFAEKLNSIRAIAWSPNDDRALVACTDGLVKVFSTSDGKELSSFKPHPLSHAVSVTWSPNGEEFITCSPDRTAIVWNAATQEKVATLAEHSFTVNQAAWSPDGQRIATAGGDSTVRIWTTAGEQTLILRHPDQVLALAWSPDGQRLASISQDGTLLIHDASLSLEEKQN